MKSLSVHIIATLLILFTTSCKNIFKTYYTNSDIYTWHNIQFYADKPQVIRSSDLVNEVKEYRKKGYAVWGHSDFHSPIIKNPEAKVQEFSQEIGAEIALWNQAFLRTDTLRYYLVTKYYSGWQTSYIDIYNYNTVYLSKFKNIGAGLFTRNLTTEEKNQKNLKSGAYIEVVMNDSPALRGGLQEGDIIVKANDYDIDESRNFELLDLEGVKSLKVHYIRNGKKKQVILIL